MRSAIILAVLFLTYATRAFASDYYASPSGLDSQNGTASAPWQSLTYAATKLKAGDTLWLYDGDYRGGVTLRASGLAGRPISIRAFNPGMAVVRGDLAPTPGDAIIVFRVPYYVFDGLVVRQAGRAGIWVSQGSHVTIQNCRFINNKTWGIFTSYCDDLLINNNECAWNSDQHGIYVSNSGDRPVVTNNRCHHNGRAGVQLNGDPRLKNASIGTTGDGIIDAAVVENNILYENGTVGAAAINLASVRNSRIVNNLIYNNYAGGIASWDDGYAPKYACFNNLYAHNTIQFRAGEGRRCVVFRNGCTGNVLRNNILSGGTWGAYEMDATCPIDTDYNVIFSKSSSETQNYSENVDVSYTLDQWRSGTGNDLHSVWAAAEFAESSVSVFDFHPTTTSAAIGAGTILPMVNRDLFGVSRPSSVRPDAGCIQGGVVATVPNSVSALSALGNPTGIGLAWKPAARAAFYRVRRSLDGGATFSELAVVSSVGYSDLLPVGTAASYYITSLNSAGESGPSPGAFALVNSSGATTLAISVLPSVVLPGSGARVTVSINQPASDLGELVLISTGRTDVLTVPVTAFIEPGATTATFSVVTKQSVFPADANIIAACGNLKSSTVLSVSPAYLSLLSVDSSRVVGGTPIQGQVFLGSPAPDGGRVVRISTTSGASAPSTVRIPAGMVSMSFTITTQIVTRVGSITLTATDGTNSRTANITVNPALQSVIVNPAVVAGGKSVVGTIMLFGPAPSGGQTVSLISSSASASVPATVFVTAGSTSATFSISTLVVNASNAVVITASAAGTSTSTSLTVRPPIPLSITITPGTVVGGVNATGKLTLDGNAPAAGLLLSLLSANTALAVTPSSVTVPSGSSSVTFTVNTRKVSAAKSVVISIPGTSVSASLKLTP